MIIEDILQLSEQIAILHGEAGIARRVAYIDVVEIPEGMHWTNANDFIITTGYFFASDEALLELLVRTLIRRGCSGLGIKVGRYIDSIPGRIGRIAEENAFPIIRIPMHFSYRDISRPLLRTLATSDSHSFSSVDTFFNALIRGDLSSEQDIRTIASKFGIALFNMYYILIARGNSAVTRQKLKELNSAIDNAGNVASTCLAADRQNSALIICRFYNSEDIESEHATSIQLIFDAIRCVLGMQDTVIAMSVPCHCLLDMHQAAYQTTALLNLGMRLYPEQREFLFENHFVDLFLSDNQNHYILNQLCKIYIAPLAQADARQNTQLLPTLTALCQHSFNISETGQALYLHRNTVYNRMKQIKTIIGSINFMTQQLLILACKHHIIQQADSNNIGK